MDLTRFFDLLLDYPSWFRGAVALWLVATAALGGGFILLRTVGVAKQPIVSAPLSPPGTTSLEKVLIQSAAPVQPPSSSSSLQIATSPDEYATRLKALSGRFLEKHEFIELHSKASIEWVGVVDNVTQHTEHTRALTLILTSQDVQPELSVFVSLPDELRTKAFSLQKGDIVRVKGVLTLSTPSMPDVDAKELFLVKARTAG